MPQLNKIIISRQQPQTAAFKKCRRRREGGGCCGRAGRPTERSPQGDRDPQEASADLRVCVPLHCVPVHCEAAHGHGAATDQNHQAAPESAEGELRLVPAGQDDAQHRGGRGVHERCAQLLRGVP